MDSPSLRKNTSHVQSVERALRLMDLLARHNREMSLTEIAKAMAWPKSTVHGLLATLRDFQYVDQSPTTGRYMLGLRLFELGNQVSRNWNIRDIALPVMRRLNHRLGEMVQLAMEDKGEVLIIEKVESSHMIRLAQDMGIRLPMHCSALGKALLAYKNPAEIQYIISQHGLKSIARRTIIDKRELDKELEKVKQQGYAMADRELTDSLRCIAAPIFDREGKAPYAISVSSMATTLDRQHLEQSLEALAIAAEEISFAMGYRPVR